MGNICRSPTAEAVFRRYVEKAGLAEHILIDSAGTHDYHIGDAPDARTQRAAKQRGYDMSNLRGRQVEAADFIRFDYVLAMDEANLSSSELCVRTMRKAIWACFWSMPSITANAKFPIRTTEASDGFECVLDMVEDAANGLLQHIRQHHFQDMTRRTICPICRYARVPPGLSRPRATPNRSGRGRR